MSYKKQFINGAKWNSIRMIVVTAVQFLTTIIVARYLSPEEYGLFGMVNVFIGLAYVFTDAGFSNAIIYKQETDNYKLSSIFWVNVIIGIGVFAFMVMISPLAAAYYEESSLVKLIILSGINFTILPFGQIFVSLNKKDFKFRENALIDCVSNIIQIITVLILAIYNYGVLSLIYARIIQSLASTAMYFIFSSKEYKIKFYLDIKEIKEFINFGLFQLGERFSNYLRGNIDYLLIGRFLGAKELGIYTLAYQLMMMPIQKINPILTDTAFPVFVKFKDDDKQINENYFKLQRTISFLTFPIIVGIFIVAPEFISKVYGETWNLAIIIVRIYCLVSIIYTLNNPIGCLLYSKGRPDIGFKWNLITAISILLFDVVGLRWGIIGVTISTTVFFYTVGWIGDFTIRKIVSGMKVKDYIINLKIPVIINLILMLILMSFKAVILTFINNVMVIIALLVIIGAVTYPMLFRCFLPNIYEEIKQKLLIKLNFITD